MSDSLQLHELYSPWNSPGQNTGVGSLSLLQGIEPRSPTLQANSLPAEPQGKPNWLWRQDNQISGGKLGFGTPITDAKRGKDLMK